jgi:polyphosphate kinase
MTPYGRFPQTARSVGDCFAAIRQKDFVVHHPMSHLMSSCNCAAGRDPNVVAIADALSHLEHRIAAALPRQPGYNCYGFSELKARFDEEANIQRARDLERAGVQVVFGFIEPDHSQGFHGGASLRQQHAELRSLWHHNTTRSRQGLHGPVIFHLRSALP